MGSFIWKIHLYKFLEAFKLIGAIFVLLFQYNGIGVFGISVLIAVWSTTQLVLEVPMGLVADKYPRRNILIVATILMAIGFVLWLHGGFIFYAIGMVLWGVKNALTSGTVEAFVYDELKSMEKEDTYGKVSGRLEGTAQLGFMFAAIIGGLIAQHNFNWVLILTILSCFLTVLVLFTTKSVKPIRSTGESKYLSILKEAFKEIRSKHTILFTILFVSLTFGISGSADEYWPLIFSNLGSNTAFIGILMAIEFGMFALAGYSFPYVEKINFKSWNIFLVFLSGILFIIFGMANSLLFLPLVFIASYLLKLALIKFDTDLQHNIGSSQRATVLSIKSLTFEIIYLITLLLFGFISTKLGIMSVLYIWGAVIIFWTLVLGRKVKNI